jgi:hypothetical protein
MAQHGLRPALSIPSSAFGPGHRPLTGAVNALVSEANQRIAALGAEWSRTPRTEPPPKSWRCTARRWTS